MADDARSIVQPAQDRIWEFFQNELPDSFRGSRSRLAHLADMVRGTGRVLNIGVGAGQFEAAAIERGIDVYALDPSPRSIDAIREGLGLGEKAQVGYGQKMPFADGFFGAVVVSEVLEHLEPADVPAVLAEIGRVLSPGGLLVGTVPAREQLADQQTVCPHCGQPFHRWGHQQSFDRQKMRSLLADHFQVEQLHERPFFAWEMLNWKGRLAAAMKWLLWRLGVHGGQEKIVFVGRRI